MPDIIRHDAGRFCWGDLITPDAEAAMTFYGRLFGWNYHDTEIGEGAVYSTILKEGKAVGGMMQYTDPNFPPHWKPYIAVASADETAAKVKAAGGTLWLEPETVMGSVGRMFVAADPEGAVFGGWQPIDHIGFERMGEHGAPMWFELYVKDPDRAQSFYNEVFGWSTRVASHPSFKYWTWTKAGDDVGGMLQITEDMKAQPPAWILQFASDDVDATHALALESGGGAITPCMDGPGNGRFAWLQDPQGAVFVVFSRK